MRKIMLLPNSEINKTSLCRNCGNYVENGSLRECEWELFVPTTEKKSSLYTPVEFDCVHFTER